MMAEATTEIVSKAKEALGLTETRETEIGFMPSEEREHMIPKFKLRKEVNQNGQIYILADKRVPEYGSSVQPGDTLSLDVFAAAYSNGLPTEGRDNREKYVDVTVTAGNRITIPSEVREELDIREGDVIAVHAYVTMSEE